MAPDTGEAEADADRNAAGPSKATTDTGDSESEGEPFPPRGALTLRALRWGGLLGGIVFGVTALVLRRGLIGAGSLIPDKSSTLTYCMIFGGLLVWPFLNFR